VIPREDERDEETESEQDVERSLQPDGEAPWLGENLNGLEDEPRGGQIGQRPLKDLGCLQALKEGLHGRAPHSTGVWVGGLVPQSGGIRARRQSSGSEPPLCEASASAMTRRQDEHIQ
jgi:hypothetical protein